MGSNEVSMPMKRCLAGLLFSLQVGCIVLDEEHCLANGGDLACPGQYCLIETWQKAEAKTDALGCTFRPDIYDFHLHLKYGLPAAVERDPYEGYLDTLEGVLVALRENNDVEDSCPLDSPALQEEFDEVLESYAGVYVVRARMEGHGRVSTTTTQITLEEAESVEAYNDAVDAWLDACLAKAASEVQ